MPSPPVPASLQSKVDATKVEYVQLGASGLRVSSPILGTMGIGSKEWHSWVMEEDEGLEILKAAWDRGLSTWDTANVYSSGRNEEIVGKAIKKFDIPREKLTILAKCCGTVPEEPSVFNWPFEAQMRTARDYVNQGGLSRSAIFKAVDASLKRLGTDYIDLLQIHRYDASVPPEETMKALNDLVQAGKVHYIGASSMWTFQFARMQFIAEKNGWTKFVSMQNWYNLCYREEEREMNKFCNETGVGLIPWSPLFSGFLAKPLGVESARTQMNLAMSGGLTEADEAINERVQELAEKKGRKMSQVALAWLRGKGCIPIVGLTSASISRLDEACAVREMRLSADEMKYLEEPSRVEECDEARPICNRCKKADVVCHGAKNDSDWIFVDENAHAVGRRRPRGPNIRMTSGSRDQNLRHMSSEPKCNSKPSEVGCLATIPPAEPLPLFISPSFDSLQEDQALAYYVRYHVDVPNIWPEIVDRWDNHLKYALADRSSSRPPSTLNLAISAVSYATFGRARKSQAAIDAGSMEYSKALAKTNLALSDAREACQDEVLLAVMLLSFYENAVTGTTSNSLVQDIKSIGARCFAHHDGAMAMLKLRRQRDHRTGRNNELDKLVRRQLMRTWLLRSMRPPSWFSDGSRFGEHGCALELDHCMMEAAKLRHQARAVSSDGTAPTSEIQSGKKARHQSIFAKAQILDDVLIIWANQRPVDDRYSMHFVQDDERAGTGDRIFGSTVHLYRTAGHAGMWNRYRAIRLIVNDIMLRILSLTERSLGSNAESLTPAVSLRIQGLADELCASIPYSLGLVEADWANGCDVAIIRRVPASLNMVVKASEASFLCWPLNEALMVSGVPGRHQRYIRDRMLDVSEVVDDGVMERVALELHSTSD
ncbi:MAG: hypothetical protein Q9208_008656 [Pyrenodesmia sp. 3 TL-2023]